MLPHRSARRLATLVATVSAVLTTWVLAGAAAAQKPLPPAYRQKNELTAARPWTYWMAVALLAGAVLLIAAIVLGYLVKGREFRANRRRGGTK